MLILTKPLNQIRSTPLNFKDQDKAVPISKIPVKVTEAVNKNRSYRFPAHKKSTVVNLIHRKAVRAFLVDIRDRNTRNAMLDNAVLCNQ